MLKTVLIFLAVGACEGFNCANAQVDSVSPGAGWGCERNLPGTSPGTKFSNIRFSAESMYKLGGDTHISWNIHVECDGSTYHMLPNHCARTDDYESASRTWDGDNDENGRGVFVCKDKFRADFINDGDTCGFSANSVRITGYSLQWDESAIAANSSEIEAMKQMMPVKDDGNLSAKGSKKSEEISVKEEVKMSDDTSDKVSGNAQESCTVTAAGQRTIYVPNCQGTGCNAQGADCAFCVYDMSACAQAFGYSACKATNDARAAQGIYGCNDKEQTLSPKLNATSVLV
jgi:hypothetical protein